MKCILSVKDKKISPATSFRMVLLHPPYLGFINSVDIGSMLA